MKKVAEESMKMAAVEEYSSSPDNLLKVSGDGTWKTRGHSSLIGYVLCNRAETGRLTDSLIDKLAHYYGNAIRCNSTSVKEMRKAIWAVWGHSCSTDDEPMHWFCPTNQIHGCASLPYTVGLEWYWARTRDKASHDPMPIPLGYRGHFMTWVTRDSKDGTKKE
ncbi:uncharacterized protein TNCV_3071461 [Trichonephila clavipes]|nr:uncharacterized protein TNCV_3071461 [Trichonephila clavipes]